MYPSIAHGVDLELLCVCAHPLGWLMLTPYKGNHVHIVSARSSEQGAWRTVGTSPRSGSLACMAPGHSWGLFDDTDKGVRLSPSPVLRVSGLGPDKAHQEWSNFCIEVVKLLSIWLARLSRRCVQR